MSLISFSKQGNQLWKIRVLSSSLAFVGETLNFPKMGVGQVTCQSGIFLTVCISLNASCSSTTTISMRDPNAKSKKGHKKSLSDATVRHEQVIDNRGQTIFRRLPGSSSSGPSSIRPSPSIPIDLSPTPPPTCTPRAIISPRKKQSVHTPTPVHKGKVICLKLCSSSFVSILGRRKMITSRNMMINFDQPSWIFSFRLRPRTNLASVPPVSSLAQVTDA